MISAIGVIVVMMCVSNPKPWHCIQKYFLILEIQETGSYNEVSNLTIYK